MWEEVLLNGLYRALMAHRGYRASGGGRRELSLAFSGAARSPREPVAFSSEAAKSINQLADELLRGPNILSPADRELIATYVSAANNCVYCQTIHGAIAAQHLAGGEEIVAEVKDNFRTARISGKLKALLIIAEQVQGGEKTIRARDVNGNTNRKP
jgi:AhpD family alkylhydroperoxidase